MLNLKRRVIFEEDTGKVVAVIGGYQSTEELEFSSNPIYKFVDFEYEEYQSEFSRAVRWHIDPVTEQPVFEELLELQPTYEELKEMLELAAGGIIG